MLVRKFLALCIVSLILTLFNLLVLDHCSSNYIVYYWITVGIMAIFWIILPFIIKDPYYTKEDWKVHFVIFLPGVIMFFLGLLSFSRAFYHYHGVSIIRTAEIDSMYMKIRRKTSNSPSVVVHYLDKGVIRHGEISPYYNMNGLDKPFIRVYVDCHNFELKEYEYRYRHHYPYIHDFAFLDDTTFYTYHDFSLIKPDLVYYQVGFNVVYNAICDTTAITDSTAVLSFNDVLGKSHSVKYIVKDYQNIPDTFLVYRNVNEIIDSVWHVCAPEVNTPENRAKISDYGYIFHYDVYSKQEIESQCPRIKEYVEQYKKRHIKRHTISSTAS